MSSGIISNVIQDVPRDPKTKNFYTYSVNSNRQQYQVALTKENQETPTAVVSGDYKSVAKDLFPTMIIAYSGTSSVDMSGSVSNTNRNKFIVNGGSLNLPYDLNGSVVQSATSFTNVTTES